MAYFHSSVRAILIVLLGFLITACASTQSSSEKTEPTTFAIAEVISKIKEELSAAQSVVVLGPKLKLKSVDLDLSVVKTANLTANGGVGIPSINLEAGSRYVRNQSRTSQVKMSLEPPAPVELISGQTLENLNLATTIVSVRRELAKGLSEEPVLTPKTIDFIIRFGVTRSISGEGGIDFLVFSAGASKSVSESSANTITVKFEAQ